MMDTENTGHNQCWMSEEYLRHISITIDNTKQVIDEFGDEYTIIRFPFVARRAYDSVKLKCAILNEGFLLRMKGPSVMVAEGTKVKSQSIKQSNARQNLLIVLCWAVYVVAYLGRYSYNSNINLIMSDYSVDHAAAGLVTTFFFFGYGVGQFVNGMLCNRYNKHFLFPMVLLASGVINIAVYFHVPFAVIKFLWLINACLQSCLWPSIILLVSQYLDEKHMKGALVLLSTTAPTGTFIVYLLSTVFVRIGQFQLSFFFSALSMGAVAVLWLLLFPKIRTMPLQTVNTGKRDVAYGAKGKSPAASIGLLVGTLCVFAVIHNLVKDGLQTWVPSILKETQGVEDSLAILLSLLLPLLGIFGAMLSLAVEKRVRNLIALCSAMFLVAVPLILLVTKVMATSTVITLLAFGILVLLMCAVNNAITGIAPLRLRTDFNSGRLAGILNACCYVGSTISSYLLGLIADKAGWNAVMYVFVGVALFALIVGTMVLLAQRRQNSLKIH